MCMCIFIDLLWNILNEINFMDNVWYSLYSGIIFEESFQLYYISLKRKEMYIVEINIIKNINVLLERIHKYLIISTNLNT